MLRVNPFCNDMINRRRLNETQKVTKTSRFWRFFSPNKHKTICRTNKNYCVETIQILHVFRAAVYRMDLAAKGEQTLVACCDIQIAWLSTLMSITELSDRTLSPKPVHVQFGHFFYASFVFCERWKSRMHRRSIDARQKKFCYSIFYFSFRTK